MRTRRQVASSFVRFVSRDPGQAAVVKLLLSLGCSQIHLCSCSLQNTSLILDRNCCGRLRVSPSCCSAFHSSVVKVLPEASLARFFADFKRQINDSGTNSLQK